MPSAPLLLRLPALKLPCCPSPFCLRRNAPAILLSSVPFLLTQKCPCCLSVVRPLSAYAEMPLLPCSCLPSVPNNCLSAHGCPCSCHPSQKIGTLPMAVPAPACHPSPLATAHCPWLSLHGSVMLWLSALTCPRWGQSCSSMPPMGQSLRNALHILSWCCCRMPVVRLLLCACCRMPVVVRSWC